MKKYMIDVDAFESGRLLAMIWDSGNRKGLEGVLSQLIDLQKRFREEAGVQIEDHGESITMVDKDGTTITRQKYGWEK